jgi:hypothetical protein
MESSTTLGIMLGEEVMVLSSVCLLSALLNLGAGPCKGHFMRENPWSKFFTLMRLSAAISEDISMRLGVGETKIEPLGCSICGLGYQKNLFWSRETMEIMEELWSEEGESKRSSLSETYGSSIG